jgi:hypothetical protein
VFGGVHVEGLVRRGADEAASAFRAHNVVLDRAFELRVREVDGEWFVFYDQQLVGTLAGAGGEGQVGVFSHAQGDAPQVFSDLRVAESAAPDPVVVAQVDLPALAAVRSRR